MTTCDSCREYSLLRALAMGSIVSSQISIERAKRHLRALEAGGERGEPIDDAAHHRLDDLHRRLEARRSAAPVQAVCIHDTAYPQSICDLDDAPRVLFTCGSPDALAQLARGPAVAIVGARRASPQGREIAYRLGRELATAGIAVVSGMAFGIDAASHRGALSAGGLTAAVLAGAPGTAYPTSHVAIHRQIVANGVVLAEFPQGARVHRWGFPARNRLIAALAQLTVVVEGRRGSGTTHTTDFATQLGRAVAAVPGSIVSPLSEVPNDLLFDGAHLVRGSTDVLDLIFGAGGSPPRELLPVTTLEPLLRDLLDAINAGASMPTALAKEFPAVSVREITRALGEMELQGLVRRTPEGGYVGVG